MILSAPPKALKSIELHVVEVHDDIRDVAEEGHTFAVRRDRDLLGGVGAVEQHLVEPVLALEGVVVVTRVPDEGVVAGTHQGGVVAVAAVDEVVAFATDEEVVAEAAVHRQLDAVGLQARGVDHVVAALPVHDQPVVGLLGKEDVDPGLEAEHGDAARVAGHADHVGALRAVDGDRVGRAIAAAIRAAQVDVDPVDVRAAEVADGDVVGTAEGAEFDAARHRPGPW